MASFCWFVQLPDRTSILLEGVSFHSLSFSVPPAQPVVSLQKAGALRTKRGAPAGVFRALQSSSSAPV
ncbi:hypothetical protein, partial [Ruthenibacterium lactatiformans]|uniref:hypothetical protein n=1 Tax=Ruthenibacterium lactatiformans TaxID=1550024 RepID=UPI003AB92690